MKIQTVTHINKGMISNIKSVSAKKLTENIPMKSTIAVNVDRCCSADFSISYNASNSGSMF